MIKILLLQPPIRDFYQTPARLLPLGLCSLKAAAERAFADVRVCVRDYHAGYGRRTVALPRALADLRPYYPFPDKSPFSTFYHYYHFGADDDAIAEDVARLTPDLVGISALFSAYYGEVLATARAIKARYTVPIIAGGAHATEAPESLLCDPSIDFVIRGEGERAFVALIAAWKNGKRWDRVPNLGYREGGTIALNPIAFSETLDDLPMPDTSDLTPAHYTWRRRPLTVLTATRGCPHRCTFCATHASFGRRHRRRSVAAILDEIAHHHQRGIRVFDFEDDNLSFDQDAFRELCNALSRQYPAGALELLAMNGLSYTSLSEELLVVMRRAGFTHLDLSLVSHDALLGRETHRPHARAAYADLVACAAALGFEVVSYQILGLPHEDRPTMLQTLAQQASLPAQIGASPFYLTPQAPLAQMFPTFSETDLLRARLTALGRATDAVSRDDIYTLFVTARILNFLKGLSSPQTASTPHQALATASARGGRTALGAELLTRLLSERTLYAATPAGLKPLLRFNASLFMEVWSMINELRGPRARGIAVSRQSTWR